MSGGRIFMYIHMTNNEIVWNYVIISSNLRTDTLFTILCLHMVPQVNSSNTLPETTDFKTRSIRWCFRPFPQTMIETQWIVTNRTFPMIRVYRQERVTHPTNNPTSGYSIPTTEVDDDIGSGPSQIWSTARPGVSIWIKFQWRRHKWRRKIFRVRNDKGFYSWSS